jgi:pimeloyl-ACP methyl ester carboxylesterase
MSRMFEECDIASEPGMGCGAAAVVGFDAAGAPDAGAILFIHGTRVTRKMWVPQLRSLADQFRVIALDLPGHGALADRPFRMEAAVREIEAVLAREQIRRALLVGSSLGGYASLEFARQHPRAVAGLVLSGCCVNLRGGVEIPFRIGERVLRRCDPRLLTWVHERLCRRMFPAEFAEPIIEAGFHFGAVPHALEALAGRDFLPLVRDFHGPVLFLNGQRDRVFRFHEHAFLAAARDGKLVIINGGSHRCNLERPAAFADAVRAFAHTLEW